MSNIFESGHSKYIKRRYCSLLFSWIVHDDWGTIYGTDRDDVKAWWESMMKGQIWWDWSGHSMSIYVEASELFGNLIKKGKWSLLLLNYLHWKAFG